MKERIEALERKVEELEEMIKQVGGSVAYLNSAFLIQNGDMNRKIEEVRKKGY